MVRPSDLSKNTRPIQTQASRAPTDPSCPDVQRAYAWRVAPTERGPTPRLRSRAACAAGALRDHCLVHYAKRIDRRRGVGRSPSVTGPATAKTAGRPVAHTLGTRSYVRF